MIAREVVVMRRTVGGLDWHFRKTDFQLHRDRSVGTDEVIVPMEEQLERKEGRSLSVLVVG